MTRQTGPRGLALELQDAYWELPSRNYVPHGAVPLHPLEDSDHLDASWTATVDSMKNDAVEGQEVRSQIRAEIDAFQERHKPESSEEAQAPATTVANPSADVALSARIGSAVNSLRRALARRARSA